MVPGTRYETERALAATRYMICAVINSGFMGEDADVLVDDGSDRARALAQRTEVGTGLRKDY